MTTPKILKAQAFAHAAHDSINQKRKYSGEPYWVHTDAVAELVAQHFPPWEKDYEDAVCAAHLHDYKEDVVTKLTTQGRLEELTEFNRQYKEFGERVDQFVTELTDVFTSEAYPQWNRATRKKREAERIGTISLPAKTVKLADLIHNTKSIVDNDAGFARTYIREKLAVLGLLSDANAYLLGVASQQAVNAAIKLDLTIPQM